MRDLDETLRVVFAELFRVPRAELRDDSRRGELEGWDSLGHLDLVSELERRFSVELDPDRVLEIETFADARRVLAALLPDA
jgi:acyl carrier protein